MIGGRLNLNQTFKVALLIMALIFLPGCGIYNLSNFVLPDDLEFLAVIESSNTPEKICNYMQENFTYEYHALYAPDPYLLWQTGKGDCNDLSNFAMWVWNYHGQVGWQIGIVFKNTLIRHCIAVYKRWNGLSFSDNTKYFWQGSKTFREIVERDSVYQDKEWVSYKVYDYEMNVIEEGKF